MLRRLAHAKLNLVLRVDQPVAEGMRKGWHPIASWMHAIDLADELTFERLDGPSAGIGIEWLNDAPRPTPIDWPIEKDLVFRAHAALQERMGQELGVSIGLRKRIPTGAGLGGGSADAACALVALNELFELDLEIKELRRIGLALGSDVPFFIDAQTPVAPAVVTGFGETIERHVPRDDPVTLFIPQEPCSTPAVYRAFDESGQRSAPADDEAIGGIARAGELVDSQLFNDLTVPALGLSADLAMLYDELGEALGGRIHLTGSGSGLFTFAQDLDAAREIADQHAAVVVSTRLI